MNMSTMESRQNHQQPRGGAPENAESACLADVSIADVSVRKLSNSARKTLGGVWRSSRRMRGVHGIARCWYSILPDNAMSRPDQGACA